MECNNFVIIDHDICSGRKLVSLVLYYQRDAIALFEEDGGTADFSLRKHSATATVTKVPAMMRQGNSMMGSALKFSYSGLPVPIFHWLEINRRDC